MFIIKNSYISHCGKKPPVAHCAGVEEAYNGTWNEFMDKIELN